MPPSSSEGKAVEQKRPADAVRTELRGDTGGAPGTSFELDQLAPTLLDALAASRRVHRGESLPNLRARPRPARGMSGLCSCGVGSVRAQLVQACKHGTSRGDGCGAAGGAGCSDRGHYGGGLSRAHWRDACPSGATLCVAYVCAAILGVSSCLDPPETAHLPAALAAGRADCAAADRRR